MRQLRVGNLKLYLTLAHTEGIFWKVVMYSGAAAKYPLPPDLENGRVRLCMEFGYHVKRKEIHIMCYLLSNASGQMKHLQERMTGPSVLGFVMGPSLRGSLQPSGNDFTSVWYLLKDPHFIGK